MRRCGFEPEQRGESQTDDASVSMRSLGDVETSAQDDLLISLSIQHLKEFGSWPKLEDVHQRIYQDLHARADVLASARRLAPKPFIGGGYSHLGEAFVPPLELVMRNKEGSRLVEGMVEFIKLACAKYESHRGQPELTSAEVQDALDVDSATARAIRELMHSVPWVTDGGASNAEGWSVTVAHEIVTRWDGLINGDDLLSRLARVRSTSDEHMAALTRAQEQMSGRDDGGAERRGDERSLPDRWDRWARYLETHPIIRILAVLGIPIALVVGIMSLIRA